jgi:hypothetical protein
VRWFCGWPSKLDVPLRERNRLLVAAGHAPAFRESTGQPEDEQVHKALQRILQVYEPYPAVAVDHRWNVLLANRAFEMVAGKNTTNLMRFGLLEAPVTNLAEVRAHLLPRLRRQAARSGDPELHALYEELRQPHDDEAPTPNPADIALPIRLLHQGRELTFINTITTFGAAFDVALEDVAVETYLPADEETARYCASLRVDLAVSGPARVDRMAPFKAPKRLAHQDP